MVFRQTKTAGVALVDDGAAGEDHDAVVLGERHGQFLPMHEIAADRMAPTHVSPRIAERIVLKKEVVFAVEVTKPIRVICPVLARRKMVLRPVGLIVSGRSGGLGRPATTKAKLIRRRKVFIV